MRPGCIISQMPYSPTKWGEKCIKDCSLTLISVLKVIEFIQTISINYFYMLFLGKSFKKNVSCLIWIPKPKSLNVLNDINNIAYELLNNEMNLQQRGYSS